MPDFKVGKIEFHKDDSPLCGLELTTEMKMQNIMEKSSAAMWQSYTDKKMECEVKAERIEKLEKVLNDFITEHCDRTGDEYWPVAADRQGCPIVEKAMKLLDL